MCSVTTAVDNMNSDPASLQNLNDIVLPAPVAWWPPAPGWYVVAVVLAVLTAWWCIRVFRHWRANAYRRAALRSFAAIKAGGMEQAQELPALLKRTALSAWPREQVAALSGAQWHAFLDGTASIKRFTANAGTLLDRLVYTEGGDSGLTAGEFDQLCEAIACWLKRHRAEAR